MQPIELPLYPTIEPINTSVSQPQTVQDYTANPQSSIEKALNTIFPQQSEEDKVIRMRKALGETAKTLSDPQVETIITEFQFLIDTWLDEYEKEVFGGMTLKEVLNEK